MVYPAVMDRWESWIIKKAESQRTGAFELWCWRRLLKVPWTSRRSNQSIIKEISPECPLEGLMLKLKLQYLTIWHKELTPCKRPWCWERLKAGGEGDDREWEDGITDLMDMSLSKLMLSWWWTVKPGVLQSMGLQRVGHNWATALNWTESKNQTKDFNTCVSSFKANIYFNNTKCIINNEFSCIPMNYVRCTILKKQNWSLENRSTQFLEAEKRT